MPVYTGKTIPNAQSQDLSTRNWLSANLQTADEGFKYNPNITAVPFPTTGSLLREVPRPYSNVFALSYVNVPPVFYNGPHFTIQETIYDGQVFQAGVITTTAQLLVALQSSSEYSITVSDISITSGQGVSLSGVSVGSVFNPYEEKTIVLDLDSAGPASFTAEVSVQFTGDPNTYFFSVTGLRFYLPFMLSANWSGSLSVSRKYLTSVFNASDSSEIRKVLRKTPLLSMSGDAVFMSQKASAQAWQFMRARALGQNVLPFYPDGQYMTQTNTTYKLFADTAYRRYAAGGLVMAVRYTEDQSVDHYDVLRIVSVEADGLVTESEVTNSYSSGDFICPAIACYPSFGADTQANITGNKGTISFGADEVYGDTAIGVENPSYTPTEILGHPVFDFDINERDDIDMSVGIQGDLSQQGRGFWFYGQGSLPYTTQTLDMLIDNRADFWDVIGFFNLVRGRGKSFWIRNYSCFIEPVDEGSGFIVVADLSASDWSTLSRVWVEDSNGAVDIVEVTLIEEVSEGVKIYFDTPSVTPSLYYQALIVRLDSDELVENWITDEVVEINFTVKELQGAY